MSKWTERTCPTCSVKFTSAKLTYCSEACRLEKTREVVGERVRTFYREVAEARAARAETRACVRCDEPFVFDGTKPLKKYCGEDCRRATDWEVRRIARKAANDNWQPPRPAIFKVLRASGWQCAVCGIDTPEDLRGTYEPNAPEVDHIVPLARGGTHDIANLQCLCRACNASKGARLMSEWRPANDNFICEAVAA